MIPNTLQALKKGSMPVFMTQDALQNALNFARQQPTPEKAQQVYRNTLAVCAVCNYLQVLGIPTDWSSCDSYNLMMQMTMNTADLNIVGYGRIECRPVSTAEMNAIPATCYVPTDVHDDRMGYIFVHIEESRAIEESEDNGERQESGQGNIEAMLLGFIPAVDTEQLPLSRVQPLDNFLVHLHQRDGHNVFQPTFYDTAQDSIPQVVTTLSHWFQNTVSPEWQSLDALLAGPSMTVQYRRGGGLTARTDTFLSRGKVLPSLTKGRGRKAASMVLVVDLMALGGSAFDITLRLQPLLPEGLLPSGLWLGLVDEVGTILMDATNADGHPVLELRFCADQGDRFDLRIQCGKTVLTEPFVV